MSLLAVSSCGGTSNTTIALSQTLLNNSSVSIFQLGRSFLPLSECVNIVSLVVSLVSFSSRPKSNCMPLLRSCLVNMKMYLVSCAW